MSGGGTRGKAAETIISSKRRVSWGSFGSIAHRYNNVAKVLRGGAAPRLPGYIGPDFDADDLGSEAGQQRGLVTVTGADLEYAFVAGQV